MVQRPGERDPVGSGVGGGGSTSQANHQSRRTSVVLERPSFHISCSQSGEGLQYKWPALYFCVRLQVLSHQQFAIVSRVDWRSRVTLHPPGSARHQWFHSSNKYHRHAQHVTRKFNESKENLGAEGSCCLRQHKPNRYLDAAFIH